MRTNLTRATLGLGLAALLIAPAQAQRGAGEFYKAYYLQHEKGDLSGALEIYETIANNRRANAEVREQARRLARMASEELACSDFANLMPANSIFYMEVNSPGDQLKSLLGQFGLLKKGNSLGISPLLIDGMIGCRGLAMSIDEIDPRHGVTGGVMILHPGSLDVVRGLLETALPFAAQPTDAIGGHETFNVEGQAFVTLTASMVIASDDRGKIGRVLKRMHGGGGDSLAKNAALASTMKMRGDDLAFFCVNLEPVMPHLTEMIKHELRHEREAQMALAFLDIESTRAIAGRFGCDENGMSFDLGLQLDEGHRNLAFNLMRMPNLDKESLKLVPAGTAFFAAATVNESGPLPDGAKDGKGRPVVTIMDFGRELFANLADVAVYAMPSVQQAQWGPMPDVVLAARVNDPERSTALWNFVLGTAQAMTGGERAKTKRKGDVSIDRFDIQGVSVYLARSGKDVFVSPSSHAIELSMKARRSGRSVLDDSAYADAIEHFGKHSVRAAALNVGRCCEIASHFMSDRERRQMAPYAEMLAKTTACFTVAQGADHMAVSGRICGLPNVAPMIMQLIDREMGGRGRYGVGAASSRSVSGRPVRVTTREVPTASRGLTARPREVKDSEHGVEIHTHGGAETAVAADAATVEALQEAFEALHASGKPDAARAVAKKLQKSFASQSMALNNFAWALLTEERFQKKYDDVALSISKTSNEGSDWSNWYYLDTYATALARQGKLEEAIKYQKKAIEAGKDDPRIDEAKATLKRLVEAANKKKARID